MNLPLQPTLALLAAEGQVLSWFSTDPAHRLIHAFDDRSAIKSPELPRILTV
ncbi:hypothetical protein ACT691_05395 [Vibrio metschnikovii]